MSNPQRGSENSNMWGLNYTSSLCHMASSPAIYLYFTKLQNGASWYLNVDESTIDVWGADYVDDLTGCCCALKLTATQRVATWCFCAQRLAGHAHVEIVKSVT